jgi:hypothetical protein
MAFSLKPWHKNGRIFALCFFSLHCWELNPAVHMPGKTSTVELYRREFFLNLWDMEGFTKPSTKASDHKITNI